MITFSRLLSLSLTLLFAGLCSAQSITIVSDNINGETNQLLGSPVETIAATAYTYEVFGGGKSTVQAKNIIITNILGKADLSSAAEIYSLAVTFSDNQTIIAYGFTKIADGIYRGLVLDDNMQPSMIVDLSSPGSDSFVVGNININVRSIASIESDPIFIADGFLVDVTSANVVNVEQVLKSMPKIKIKLEEVLATGKSMPKIKIKLEEVLATGKASVDGFCWQAAQDHMLENSIEYDTYDDEMYTMFYHSFHSICVWTLSGHGF